MLPKLDPAGFVWFRVGGDLELHLMLHGRGARRTSRTSASSSTTWRGCARSSRQRASRRATRRRSSAGRASPAATRSGTWSSWRRSRDDGRPRRDRRRHDRRQGRRDLRRRARCSRTAEEHYPLSTPQPGWAEQDPEDWWRAAEAVRARLPEGPVGLSGQMHGLVVLGEGGEVLRPAILWNDGRTGEECAEIERRVGLDRLIALTGNRALAGFTAPKLLWLRRHEPEIYARIRHVLLPKDYVRYRLTGERAIDAADASGTLLFDVAQPALVGGGLRRARGAARLAAARRTSRPRSPARATRPRPRSGVGIDRPGPVSVVLGTSGVVFAVLPGLRARPRGARARLLPRRARDLARDGRDALGRGLVRRGCAACSTRPFASARRGGRRRGRPAPRACCSRRTSPGERTPHADPDARGAFTGLSLRHDRGALARAVMEGVAYGLRDSLELLRELGVAARGRPPRGRRRAQRAVDADRRVGARPAARAHRDRGRLGLRRRAARGRARGRRSPTRPRRSRAACASRRASSRTRRGSRPTRTATRRFRTLYPALQPLEGR